MCGNDRPADISVCRFCGTRNSDEVSSPESVILHRVINIEIGRPVVADAINKLTLEIERASREKLAVVTIIHGYGSSGQGGAIRQECRKLLQYWESQGKIKSFIIGEKFSRKEGVTRSLLRRFSQLSNNDNLNRKNRGVTLVVIR